jgi:hypothetical protein
MNSDQDELKDEQWLSALDGKPDPAADPTVNAEAAALRTVMLARNERLSSQVPHSDAALFEKTLFRLRREGLLDKRPRWGVPQIGALAAAITLGIALTVHMQSTMRLGEQDVWRGGGTVLIADDVEKRLGEILKSLSEAGEKPVIERKEDGRIVLKARATPEVLDALGEQRIEPEVANGMAILVLQPSQKAD